MDLANAIETTLDRVVTDEFFTPTLIASGHNVVRKVLLNTAELNYLIQHARDSVPRILRRLQKVDGVKKDQTRIAYFLVLEAAHDRQALQELARYLESLPDAQAGRVGLPWHPFLYATDAAATIAALAQMPPSTAERFRRRREIAAQLQMEIQKKGK